MPVVPAAESEPPHYTDCFLGLSTRCLPRTSWILLWLERMLLEMQSSHVSGSTFIISPCPPSTPQCHTGSRTKENDLQGPSNREGGWGEGGTALPTPLWGNAGKIAVSNFGFRIWNCVMQRLVNAICFSFALLKAGEKGIKMDVQFRV